MALAATVFFMLIQTSSEPGVAFNNTSAMPAAHTFQITRVDGFGSLDGCNIVAQEVVKNQMVSTKAVTRYTKADCYPFIELQEPANGEE